MAQQQTDGSGQEGCNGAATFNTAASTVMDDSQSQLHLQLFTTEANLKLTKHKMCEKEMRERERERETAE
jgi:hypothetical protein